MNMLPSSISSQHQSFSSNSVWKSVSIAAIAFICLITPINAAQLDSISLEHRSPQYQDYLGWGLNFASGSTRENRTGIMLSTMYSHQFSEQWSGEVSFNLAQRDYQVNSLDLASNRTVAQTIIMADATAFYRLSQNSRNRLLIGVGPSMQYQNAFFSAYIPAFLLGRQPNVLDIYFVQVIDHYTLGANAKVDYWIPIGDTAAEVGFRLQSQLFFWNFAGSQDALPVQFPTFPKQTIRDWSLSLGVFLRFGV
jgi:hypothetical protein